MKALITGISGQDAAYLAKLLLKLGYEVIGTTRRNASGSLWRLEKLGIKDKVQIINMELTDTANVFNVIKDNPVVEIYNLAAMSFVGSSFNNPEYTIDVNMLGVQRILDAVKLFKLDTKIYQASTSEMFGKVAETPQKETTLFHPRSPYGYAKAGAYYAVVNYREAYNMFTCNGILFNHESPLRGSEFVTKKIVEQAVKQKLGLTDKPIKLGNIQAKRDWGCAEDYVYAMYLMMQHKTPDDYIIATGETHTVAEFIDGVSEVLNYRPQIEISPEFYRPSDVELLQGDSTKARNVLGWKPVYSFMDLISYMVSEELLCYSDTSAHADTLSTKA